mmetsp:Transcript_133735/g.298981  ORF Transcript_133735/g.298981 Transcript_133735/m.298981 type:complete len:211 (-) Transcript_133735:158-790(-)
MEVVCLMEAAYGCSGTRSCGSKAALRAIGWEVSSTATVDDEQRPAPSSREVGHGTGATATECRDCGTRQPMAALDTMVSGKRIGSTAEAGCSCGHLPTARMVVAMFVFIRAPGRAAKWPPLKLSPVGQDCTYPAPRRGSTILGPSRAMDPAHAGGASFSRALPLRMRLSGVPWRWARPLLRIPGSCGSSTRGRLVTRSWAPLARRAARTP